jgi:hypothetical protein
MKAKMVPKGLAEDADARFEAWVIEDRSASFE